MSRDPLTKEQMEAMNFEKVWISYGVDDNGVDDGEWGVILSGSLACLGCKRESQCATKGCFIIREALCLLGVSDLDTVPQSTEVDDGKGN